MDFVKIIKENINKVIIVIVMIFVLTFVYNYMQDSEVGALSESVVSDNMDDDAMEILKTLNELEHITINTDFFDKDLSALSSNLISFNDLEDFSEKDIAPKNIGKPNPFTVTEGSFAFNEINFDSPDDGEEQSQEDSGDFDNIQPETIAE